MIRLTIRSNRSPGYIVHLSGCISLFLSLTLTSFSHCVRPRNMQIVPLIERLQLINYQLAIFPVSQTNVWRFLLLTAASCSRMNNTKVMLTELHSGNSRLQVEINKNSRSRNFPSRNELYLQTNYCSRYPWNKLME